MKRTPVLLLLVACVSSLVVRAAEPKTETSPSGLIYQAVKEGKGVHPGPASVVRVNYRGTFQNGREFDSSYKTGSPIEFPLRGVIPCWTEGLQKMKEGGRAKLVCPPQIAYGKRGAGGVIPPDATLNFEVELLKIVKP